MTSVVAPGVTTLGARRTPWAGLALLAAALAVYVVFPDRLSLASYVVVVALFAVSLDVALGIAGIVTLGHAVFFGCGAYAAGLLARAGWPEPITGALAGGLVAAALAGVVGPFILRLTGLPLVMVTLAINVFAFEIAGKLTWITGGDDGLSNIDLAPVLGLFPFSFFGATQYGYALAWLVVLFVLAQRFAASPLGLTLRGIRENRVRTGLIGCSVIGHLAIAYAFSAFIAGIAGALLAQTTEFVGLEVLNVETSIDVLIMLVLGGAGQLYGGLLGAPVYLLVKEASKQWNPHAWAIVIGCLLIVVMLFARGGLYGVLAHVHRRFVTARR